MRPKRHHAQDRQYGKSDGDQNQHDQKVEANGGDPAADHAIESGGRKTLIDDNGILSNRVHLVSCAGLRRDHLSCGKRPAGRKGRFLPSENEFAGSPAAIERFRSKSATRGFSIRPRTRPLLERALTSGQFMTFRWFAVTPGRHAADTGTSSHGPTACRRRENESSASLRRPPPCPTSLPQSAATQKAI